MEKPIPNVHKKKVQVRTPPHQNWSFVQFPGVSVPLDAMATLLSYLDELPSAAHRMLDAAGWCPPPHDERERADGDVADRPGDNPAQSAGGTGDDDILDIPLC